ncbi:beta-1,4 N-acetylgalactosaminyltransferase 2 [Cebus imitator]|uniref:beta-1,4 N-acetylgalactosaminyltransferase 2 n=1 Tax=Cebus imitator TaxID=2715852 RepID=UPI00189BF7F6|nr:beta-1,4 N-acetylgalactosaminyltransferase 2 [Cebus imitator]
MTSGGLRFLQLLKISVLILGFSVVGFMLRGVSLQAVFSSLKPELTSPAQGVQELKLLPEEHLRNLFTYDGIWLFPKNQCKCEANQEQGSYNFQDAYSQSDLPAVNVRRQAEFEHFQRREGLPRPLPLLAQPNLPFGYPVHGVEVMPLHTVPIPGLQFEGPNAPVYEVSPPPSPHDTACALTLFLPPVSLESRSSVAKFPVTIRNPVIPKLYDPGPGKALVLGAPWWHSVKLLEKFRRDLTSFHLQGWFAGRNLAVSQVTTKYVLWVDDDFLFNDETKIEVLVDVLEKTELDVVGGSVLGNVFQFKLLLEQSENGACLHKRTGFFQPLDGFPSCVVTSGVVNFFLAHTERLQRVGFDPRLQRVAHSEFFIDGLGTLLVGSCPEVTIGHQSRSPVADSELAALEKTYNTYRANSLAQIQFKLALHYFKNHLQCAT